MKYVIKLALGWMLMHSLMTWAQDYPTYQLSTDDIVAITVFNEPDLSLTNAKITDDGNISVPLLGQVQIKGKTVPEVEQLLTEQFGKDYLKKPSVSVTVVEYRPFYINGEVKKPGSYPFRVNMTVQMAVTIAGGFTERASKNNIYVLSAEGAERKKVAISTQVTPGDIITVDESFF